MSKNLWDAFKDDHPVLNLVRCAFFAIVTEMAHTGYVQMKLAYDWDPNFAYFFLRDAYWIISVVSSWLIFVFVVLAVRGFIKMEINRRQHERKLDEITRPSYFNRTRTS